MSELTSDNQPTQSFDEKLESLANDLINAFPGYTGIDGDLSGRTAYLVTKRTANIAAIKAAIVEAMPEYHHYAGEHAMIYNDGYFAALDEWSKNMGVE